VSLSNRLMAATLGLVINFGIGTVGLWWIGGGKWALGECAYMVVITLTTVGFGEVLSEFASTPYARGFLVYLMIFGTGTVLYFVSNLAAAIIEADLTGALRRKRMKKKLAETNNHYIVCGAGSTGGRVIAELLEAGETVIAIDRDAAPLEHLDVEVDGDSLLSINGDATRDEVLNEAGIDRARGLVAALADDKDNLYLVLSARSANPGLRIVSRGTEPEVLRKLERAGADAVVSPNQIGGSRLVLQLIRPGVVQFLDRVRSGEESVGLEELEVEHDSPMVGKTLRDSGIRAGSDLLVLAARRAGDTAFVFHPSADFELEPGMHLVVLGPKANVTALRRSL
jgi:voltage-gated potassium channel